MGNIHGFNNIPKSAKINQNVKINSQNKNAKKKNLRNFFVNLKMVFCETFFYRAITFCLVFITFQKQQEQVKAFKSVEFYYKS